MINQNKFRPMKGENVIKDGKDRSNLLTYPMIGSEKLDGIRFLATSEHVLSCRLKPIRNRFIRETLLKAMSALKEFHKGNIMLDGELCIPGLAFNEVSSAVNSVEGEPDFRAYVFDSVNFSHMEGGQNETFVNRLTLTYHVIKYLKPIAPVYYVPQYYVKDYEELVAIENHFLRIGAEGVMLRSPSGKYKYGRSTFKEGTLLKLKRYEDDECRIIGFTEQEENNNVAEVNELGLSKRSSSKENKVGKDTLGSFEVECSKFGKFFLGTGMSDALRKEVWENKSDYLGKLIKFKYQGIGTLDKPRQPSFLGFRQEWDLTENEKE